MHEEKLWLVVYVACDSEQATSCRRALIAFGSFISKNARKDTNKPQFPREIRGSVGGNATSNHLQNQIATLECAMATTPHKASGSGHSHRRRKSLLRTPFYGPSSDPAYLLGTHRHHPEICLVIEGVEAHPSANHDSMQQPFWGRGLSTTTEMAFMKALSTPSPVSAEQRQNGLAIWPAAQTRRSIQVKARQGDEGGDAVAERSDEARPGAMKVD